MRDVAAGGRYTGNTTPATRIEHFVDCETGDAVDRDYEGELPAIPEDAGAARREEALTLLRSAAEGRRVLPQSVFARAVLTVLGEP